MSDLISRSALLAYLENEKRKIKADSKKYRMHEEAVAGMKASLQAIENKVNEMQTAYDVSKVVAELEEEKTMAYDKCDGGSSYKAYSQAIDIVRRGGVE